MTKSQILNQVNAEAKRQSGKKSDFFNMERPLDKAYKNSLDYMGKHTCISHLFESGMWKKVPYLKENNGMIPPFVIVVGDRRRVLDSAKVLGLINVVKLHEVAKKLVGEGAEGRVNAIIGTYCKNGSKIPVAIIEHQMGVSPVQINLLEVAAHTSFTGYNLGKKFVTTNGAYMIRAGSAGGINTREKNMVEVNVGDIVNATESIGNCGAVMQSLGGLNYLSQKAQEEFRKKWTAMGNTFTQDGDFSLAKSSNLVIEAINKAASEFKVTMHNGVNFTKDSLYAEANEEDFVELRQKYGAMSTEMEQIGLSELEGKCKKIGLKLNIGLVSGIVGCVPGGSFAADAEGKKRAADVEKNVLLVSARAMWHISKIQMLREWDGQKS